MSLGRSREETPSAGVDESIAAKGLWTLRFHSLREVGGKVFNPN
jgi:hypothetical protein